MRGIFTNPLGPDSGKGLSGRGVEEKWRMERHVAFLQGTIHLVFSGPLEHNRSYQPCSKTCSPCSKTMRVNGALL